MPALQKCGFSLWGCGEPILVGELIVTVDCPASEGHGAVFHQDCWEAYSEVYYGVPERPAWELLDEMLEHGITPSFELECDPPKPDVVEPGRCYCR